MTAHLKAGAKRFARRRGAARDEALPAEADRTDEEPHRQNTRRRRRAKPSKQKLDEQTKNTTDRSPRGRKTRPLRRSALPTAAKPPRGNKRANDTQGRGSEATAQR